MRQLDPRAGTELPRFVARIVDGVLARIGLGGARWIHDDYLRKVGWVASHRCGESVAADGSPIPWITYSAIEFLAARVKPHFTVFEYGCGNSTRWWAHRVARVVGVEHDRDWYERIVPTLPLNAEVAFIPVGVDGAYAAAAVRRDERFSIIVIDGRDRVNCVRRSLVALAPEGVLLFDNSDRTEYAPAYELLRDHGFRKLPFVGLAPLISEASETAIFYRPGNILDI